MCFLLLVVVTNEVLHHPSFPFYFIFRISAVNSRVLLCFEFAWRQVNEISTTMFSAERVDGLLPDLMCKIFPYHWNNFIFSDNKFMLNAAQDICNVFSSNLACHVINVTTSFTLQHLLQKKKAIVI